MLLTLKEPEIRAAIVNYIASVLGNNPATIDPESISITAGRGVNGLTAEVDVSLLRQPLATTEIKRSCTVSTPSPVTHAKEVQEELPFEDAALEPAESVVEESSNKDDESDAEELEEAKNALEEAYEQEVAEEAIAQDEEEEEPVATPTRRKGSLFGKKKDTE